jgi:hypothetical protein
VISLRLRVAVREDASWADLLSVMRSLERTDLAAVFGPALSALTLQLQPAIVRPAVAAVVEDYTIYAWRLGLARKLQIFRDTYAMLNDEAQTARGDVLEVIIILLIVTEVILGLVRH